MLWPGKAWYSRTFTLPAPEPCADWTPRRWAPRPSRARPLRGVPATIISRHSVKFSTIKASVGFANIWGVADEYLFDNSLTQLDQVYASGKPFLAQIMTTSNHRPYTYPNGRIDIPSPSNPEGTVKYTDYAIGRFIEQASTKPWFKDTLFVIVDEHYASAAGKTRLPVAGYRIPLIFYAPALLAPGRDNRLASQIDIPPTLLDVLNQTGGQRFFGQSLFKSGPGDRRAFI